MLRSQFSRASALATLALTLSVLAPSGTAQSFKLSLSNGSSCSGPPCSLGPTDSDQPQLESIECTSTFNNHFQGSSLTDRGLLAGDTSVFFPGGSTSCAGLFSHSELSVDVVFAGPPAASIAVSFPVELSVASSPVSAFISASAANATGSLGGQTATGLNTGILHEPNLVSTFVISATVVPNVPVKLKLFLAVSAQAGHLTASSKSTSGSLGLLPGSTVFNLPPGYTAQSAALNIVDNVWVGPDLAPDVSATSLFATACAQSDVALDVIAAGTALQYAWRRDGLVLSDGPTGSGSILSGTAGAQLSIQNVSAADEGAYDCVVSNLAGSATSSPTVLHVAPPVVTYCTSKASSIPGCVPSIATSGTPSASAGAGFPVLAGPAPGGNFGLFLVTPSGSAAAPTVSEFGFLCIDPTGMQRVGIQNGGGTPGACDGNFQFDFNTLPQSDPSLVAGSSVDAQVWYRDTANPGGANFTEAVAFVYCP